MKNIIVPVDFSELSGYAMDMATKIARKSGAAVTALKIIDVPGDVLFDKNGNLLDCAEYDAGSIRREAAESESKFPEWLAAFDVPATGIVKMGHWYENILREAENTSADLLVMGTEFTTGIREKMMASVADKVVRKSDLPVLTLKCDRADLEIRRIALVGDFRSPQTTKLDAFKAIAAAFGAEIFLVKINTQNDFETHRQVHERMHAFAQMNDLPTDLVHIYSDRSVEEGIKHFSEDFHIDLLAIGTHMRSDFSHLFRGSIAEGIVNHLFKPILTFKL